jgi:hypothetical protein
VATKMQRVFPVFVSYQPFVPRKVIFMVSIHTPPTSNHLTAFRLYPELLHYK